MSLSYRRTDRIANFTAVRAASPGDIFRQRRTIHHDPESLRSFAENVGSSVSEVELLAAETLIEAALIEPHVDQALADFGKAAERLGKVSVQEARQHRAISGPAIRAAMLQHSLPAYQSHRLAGEIPNMKLQEKIYAQQSQFGAALVEDEPQKMDKALFIPYRGALAEFFTGMLLQRFSLSIGEPSWHATPTTYTEDQRGRKGSEFNSSWDFTVHTQLPEEPMETAYKVQVKSGTRNSHKPHVNRRYSEDIAVVYLEDDVLLTPKRQHLGIRRGIELIVSEAAEPKRTTALLDHMTGLLLDKLDEAA